MWQNKYYTLKCLECDLTYESDKDMAIKINWFEETTDTISKMLRKKSEKEADEILQGCGCAYIMVLFRMQSTKTGGLKGVGKSKNWISLGSYKVIQDWIECITVIYKLHRGWRTCNYSSSLQNGLEDHVMYMLPDRIQRKW